MFFCNTDKTAFRGVFWSDINISFPCVCFLRTFHVLINEGKIKVSWIIMLVKINGFFVCLQRLRIHLFSPVNCAERIMRSCYFRDYFYCPVEVYKRIVIIIFPVIGKSEVFKGRAVVRRDIDRFLESNYGFIYLAVVEVKGAKFIVFLVIARAISSFTDKRLLAFFMRFSRGREMCGCWEIGGFLNSPLTATTKIAETATAAIIRSILRFINYIK